MKWTNVVSRGKVELVRVLLGVEEAIPHSIALMR
jgi:hypothetical protein